MPIRLALGLSALMAAVLLPGCADRFYEARLVGPDGAASQACVARCTRLKAECEGRQSLREQDCQQRVAAAADQAACAPGGSSPCLKPEFCLGADMSICRQQYEACFVGCGGRVERQLRPSPWTSPPKPQTAAPANPQSG